MLLKLFVGENVKICLFSDWSGDPSCLSITFVPKALSQLHHMCVIATLLNGAEKSFFFHFFLSKTRPLLLSIFTTVKSDRVHL